MDHDRMLAVLAALADGIDPATGAAFPADSAYQRSETVRALFLALRLLEGAAPAGASSAKRPATVPSAAAPSTPAQVPAEAPQPAAGRKPSARGGNAGKAWTEEEDQRLAAGFDAGGDIDTLAKAHGRSRLALEIRLAKLGRLPMPENTRYGSGRPAGARSGDVAPRTATEPAAVRYAAAARSHQALQVHRVHQVHQAQAT